MLRTVVRSIGWVLLFVLLAPIFYGVLLGFLFGVDRDALSWVMAWTLMLAWFVVRAPMAWRVAGAAAEVAARVWEAGCGLAEVGMVFRLDNFETYQSILARYGKGGGRSNFPRRKNNWFAALCAAVALAYVVLSRTVFADFFPNGPGFIGAMFFSLYSIGIATALFVNQKDNRENVPGPQGPPMGMNAVLAAVLFLLIYYDADFSAAVSFVRTEPFFFSAHEGVRFAWPFFITLFLPYAFARNIDFAWELAPILAFWGILRAVLQILIVYVFVTHLPSDFDLLDILGSRYFTGSIIWSLVCLVLIRRESKRKREYLRAQKRQSA